MVVIQNPSSRGRSSAENQKEDTQQFNSHGSKPDQLDAMSGGGQYSAYGSSASRSETDFDMQASMVRGAEQLKAFRA